MFYGHHVGTHSGGKLYKKEILLQHPYPEGMIYEDLAVAYEHIACCEEIAVSDLNLYKYYRRPGSIVNSSYSDRLLDFYKAMEWNRAYVERDYPDDPEMKKRSIPAMSLMACMWSMLCWVLICMIKLTKFAKSIVAIGKIF